MKLNEDEKKLVETNHNLIYGYIRDRNLDIEEYYGLLAIELCKCVRYYDESIGELSTLYYKMCDNLINSKYVKNNAKKRSDGEMLLSLDYEYVKDGFEYTLLDKHSDTHTDSLENELHSKMILEKLINGKFGNIVKLRYEGYTQSEISKITGWSQSYISDILRDIREGLEDD